MLHIEDIKKIRLSGQHLTNKADKQTVVRDLNGLQAQFMANAFHSLRIRTSETVTETTLGEGLVKNWTVRSTVHVFSKDDLPLFIRKNYRCNDWSIPTWWNSRSCWSLTPQRQSFFSNIILEAIEAYPKTRDELRNICRIKGMTDSEDGSMFDPWGGGIRELCERGFMNYTVRQEKEYTLCPEYEPLSDEEAETELMRRYFEHFSPSTLKDATYYFGYTQAKVKSIIKSIPLSSFVCDGAEYFHLKEIPTELPEIPKCILLSGFDQLMLGYKKEENIFLPKEYLRGIFNLSGIVMPAILFDGKVVGRWKHKNGKMSFELFENLSEKDKTVIEDTASEFFNIKKSEFSII